MQVPSDNNDSRQDKNFIDYFMYALAGGAFAAISFSFLIWLQF